MDQIVKLLSTITKELSESTLDFTQKD